MKYLSFILLIPISCNQANKKTIQEQSQVWEGGRVYENNCLACHRHPQTLDLTKIDTTNFNHKGALTWEHLTDLEVTNLMKFIRINKTIRNQPLDY